MTTKKILPELDYRITYCITFHNPPISSVEVPEDHGACDAVFIGSYKADQFGRVDYGFRGVHETGSEMEPLHMFQVWLQLAGFLETVLPDGGPKELCLAAKQTYLAAAKMAKEEMAKEDTDKVKRISARRGKKDETQN
jgi:hypothetical protein